MHKTKDLPYPWPHELPTLCGKVTTLRMPTLSDDEALVRVLGDEVTLLASVANAKVNARNDHGGDGKIKTRSRLGEGRPS
jgi:hypothetical protein